VAGGGGRGIIFNGTNQYGSATLQGSGSATAFRLEGKIRSASLSPVSEKYIFSEDSTFSFKILASPDDKVEFNEGNQFSAVTPTSSDFLFRCQFNGSGTVSLELWNLDGSGRLVSSGTTSNANRALNLTFGIGATAFGSAFSSIHVDYLRIYTSTVALNSTPPSETAGSPLHNWEFTDNGNDSAGTANLTLVNSPTFEDTP
jgi:hypothetical protein